LNGIQYSLSLNHQVTEEDAERCAKGRAEDWANESNRAAVDFAYKFVLAGSTSPKLDARDRLLVASS
jgi:predicted trehalose synthase